MENLNVQETNKIGVTYIYMFFIYMYVLIFLTYCNPFLEPTVLKNWESFIEFGPLCFSCTFPG